jgi:bifunctional DNA-binding transcriptional regulator/antitoxin component of YhaV-PrlF toxin-antitoxin module
MTTRVSTNGRIVLPVALRACDKIKPGQEFEVQRLAEGQYELTRCAKRLSKGRSGLL